jgi:hypothetical protein
MSDTVPRNPGSAPQMLADALLRSVAGASAQLRVTGTNTDANQFELGLVATTLYVVMRRLKPDWKENDATQWEMLVSATSVAEQVQTLSLDSAQALFAQTLAVTVGGKDYLIQSVASNEAFGQVYLYRLLLREATPQSL